MSNVECRMKKLPKHATLHSTFFIRHSTFNLSCGARATRGRLHQLGHLPFRDHHGRFVRRFERARGGDERAEQRVRGGGARAVLRMELAAEEPGMVLELDDLDELAVRRGAGDAEALLLERRNVLG